MVEVRILLQDMRDRRVGVVVVQMPSEVLPRQAESAGVYCLVSDWGYEDEIFEQPLILGTFEQLREWPQEVARSLTASTSSKSDVARDLLYMTVLQDPPGSQDVRGPLRLLGAVLARREASPTLRNK